MNTKTIAIAVLALAIPFAALTAKPKDPKKGVETNEVSAQTAPAVSEPEEEAPTVTEECVVNMSLFNESCKNKMFAEAYEPWWSVYTTCPNANKVIYTQGAKIVEWMYSNAKDEAEKERLRNLIMEMHDKRIKYFGDDPRYPRAYVLGLKGLDYCQYFENDTLKLPAYAWLKESIEKIGPQSQINVLVKFFEVSHGLYRSDPDKYGEQYLADYAVVSGFLQKISEDPKHKNASAAAQRKEYVENLFAVSGAASCDKLDELFGPFVDEHEEIIDDLMRVIRLYRRVGCTESDVYFEASSDAHKLQPTEESAAGCAFMCLKKEEWENAIEYYKEAITLCEDPDDEDIADYYYRIGIIYYDKLHRYMDARTYANRSLDQKAGQGRCYTLIGLCYAASKPYSEADYGAAKAAILNKTVFWVAVDKFIKAKTIDPSCADEVNKLISSYSKYFPTKEEMFDLPNEFGSGTFTVGSWINESTTCRPAK